MNDEKRGGRPARSDEVPAAESRAPQLSDESPESGAPEPPREPRVAPEDLTGRERRIVARLEELIVEVKEEARGKAYAGARLQSDVGLDSVAIIDLVIAAEDEFGVEIPDDETGGLMDATLAELARRVGQLAEA